MPDQVVSEKGVSEPTIKAQFRYGNDCFQVMLPSANHADVPLSVPVAFDHATVTIQFRERDKRDPSVYWYDVANVIRLTQ